MSEIRCKDCGYWEEKVIPGGKSFARPDLKSYEHTGIGLCRIKSPKQVNLDGLATWPETSGKNDWCGEWKPAKP